MKSILIFFGLVICSAATAQRETLNDIESRFNEKISQEAFSEKVFVHLDKPRYTAGEISWFRIYVTDGVTNIPSSLSKVVYAELLNDKNEAVLQGKIGMVNGSGSGSFYFPLTIPSGNYRFRAYTSWMKNGSPDRFFQQDLLIINSLVAPPVELLDNTQDSLIIDLFPEGGNLVNELESRVGIKVTDRSGKPINYTGRVTSGAADTLGSFSSHRSGLGQFNLKPVTGQTYYVEVMYNGRIFTKNLPSAAPAGVVIVLADAGSDIRISASASANLRNQQVFLLAYNHTSLKSGQYQQLTDQGASFLIDKKLLGPGISHMVLFNAEKQPICERLWFNVPEDLLSLEASIDKGSVDTRSLLNLDITATDASKTAVRTKLSAGVFKLTPGQQLNVNSIAAYLWLTSELPGNIDSADFYLRPGVEADLAREDLMLTHGWTRFSQGTPVKEASFDFLPEYEGMVINGTAKSRLSGQPIKDEKIYVASIGQDRGLGLARTNEIGEFTSVLQYYYGPADLVVQSGQEATDQVFEIADPFSRKYSAYPVKKTFISATDRQSILEDGIGSQAQNIFLQEQIQRVQLPYNADSTAFYGTPDSKFILDRYTRFNTMEEVMREYVSAVNVRKIGGRFHFRVNNQPRARFFTEDPLVLLDGVPVFNVDKIATYDPLKVWKIEVVHRQYLMNNVSIPGIVSYETYDHRMPGFEMDPAALVLNYEGLQMQRQFYSPEYTTLAQRQSRIPDLRNQLFWSGDLTSVAAGVYRASFYTSDVSGTYVGMVQGVSEKGQAGVTWFTFQVK